MQIKRAVCRWTLCITRLHAASSEWPSPVITAASNGATQFSDVLAPCSPILFPPRSSQRAAPLSFSSRSLMCKAERDSHPRANHQPTIRVPVTSSFNNLQGTRSRCFDKLERNDIANAFPFAMGGRCCTMCRRVAYTS